MALTKQDIFDRVWTHFILNKQPFGVDDRLGKCAYRGAGGTRCAVGLFIDDDEYTPDMEGSFNHLFGCYSFRLRQELSNHAAFMQLLQGAHDGSARCDVRGHSVFEDHLRGIARAHYLHITEPTT